MDPITIDAGTLEFSDEELTASGLLIPFGVRARSNVGEFTFAKGDVQLPSDTTGMSLNVEHRREDVAGAVTRAWEQDEGVFAAFKFADTAEGRAAYADAKSGKRKHLSAEVRNVRIRGGKALPGSALFAAAVVERPAFDGATLLAAEDTVDVNGVELPAESTSSSSWSEQSADGSGEDSETTTTQTVEDLGDGVTRITRVVTTTTTITEPAADTDTSDDDPETEPAQEGTTMTASVPGTLLAGAPTINAAADETEVDLGSIFAAMSTLKTGMRDEDAETLLAALSDIKTSGTGALAGAGVLQPAWVGKLWQGKRYERKWLDLWTHLYGGIQLGGRKGFKLNQGTALVKKWNGNKTEIGSGTASTTVTGSSIQAYGYAADVAREWYDLEGGGEVLAAFFEGVVDSYAKVTDLDALAAAYAVAATQPLLAPDTYPARYEDSAALGMLIQAIEAVQDADDDPTAAIVNPVAWKQLIYTPKDLIPEYVQFDFSTGGTGTADSGKVVVRRAPAETFTDLDAAAPQVWASAKSSIEFREQGQTPIQIDALDIAKGGIDKAVIGYLETFVVRPEGMARVGTAAAAG